MNETPLCIILGNCNYTGLRVEEQLLQVSADDFDLTFKDHEHSIYICAFLGYDLTPVFSHTLLAQQ